MKARHTITLALAGLALAAATLGACKGSKGGKELPGEINIGYLRLPNDELIAIQLGYIQQYCDSLGVKLNLRVVDSGVEANQAFASASLDFASMGHTNGVVSLVKGLDTELVWIHQLLGKAEGLVVRNGKGIHSVRDLKGRTVATIFSSTSHYMLMTLLKAEGIEKDVQVIDMLTQNIVAAWKRGDIDAAYTLEPGLAECVADNGRVLVSSEDMVRRGYITANIGLARKGFARQYPDVMAGILAAIERGNALYQADQKAAIDACAKNLGLSHEETKKQTDGSIWLTARDVTADSLMGDGTRPGQFVEVMKATADFLHAQRSIERTPSKEEIARFINPEYAVKARKAVYGK